MKVSLVILMLALVSACGPNGLHQRQDSEPLTEVDLDAYYPEDDSSAGQQLEFDYGDDSQTQDQKVDDQQDQQTLPPDTQPAPQASTDDQPANKSESQKLPADVKDMSEEVLLKPTVYYLPSNDVAPFRNCSETDVKAFKAVHGQNILPKVREIRVCSKFFYEVQMEGSGIVKTHEGQEYLVNYVGLENNEARFKVVNRDVCPYGLGMSNVCLQPFISIAADPGKYQVGDVIYVPAVANAKIRLPDGDIHNGFFIVTDTGAAIRGNGRFDFYTGPLSDKDKANPFRALGLGSISNKSHMTYRLVKRDSSTAKRVQQYYKGRQIIPYLK